MVELYAKLIVAKKRDIDTVPAKLRQEVVDLLLSWGYDEHGDPITAE